MSDAVEISAFRQLPAGHRLFSEGDPADGAYLIAGGAIEVRRRLPSGTVDVATLAAGDIVGEMALFGGGTRSADAVVTADAHLIFLSREEFAQRVEAMDPIMRQVSRILVQRIRTGNQQSADG